MILSHIFRSNMSKFRCYTNTAAKLINVAVNDETGCATVYLNKPPVNSLGLELLTELSTVLESLETQNSKGLILTSSLENVFSAGLDFTELSPNPQRFRQFWTTFQDVWMKLYGCRLPTVALINGHAPAGGCLLASCCDYRIMLKNFTIGFNETKVGFITPPFVIKTFENIVGRRKAEYAFTTGRMFTTNEALQMGLVDEIQDNKTDALTRAEAFLIQDEIPDFPRSETKLYFRKGEIEELRNNREQDLHNFYSQIETPTFQKNFQLHLQKLKEKKSNNA